MSNIETVTEYWRDYIGSIGDYERLVAGIEPNIGGCGWVYELPDHVDRPDESVAIAIMNRTDMPISEAHFHKVETEIYVFISGLGRVAVGSEHYDVAASSTVIIPNLTSHYTIPEERLVLAVINTPRFQAERYIAFDTAVSFPAIGFDAERYDLDLRSAA